MSNGKFDRLAGPPPPLFLGKPERDFAKQVNDELIERVIGQQIAYFPISMEATNFHPLYGEAIEKTFLSPVRVYALIEWIDNPTETTNYGADNTSDINIHFHKRRLVEDQNLYVRVGDFVCFDDDYYEIIQLSEPKLMWGQGSNKVEISARCLKARQDLFDGT
jgi:hypothetical protein